MGWFEGHIWRWTLAWKREFCNEEVQQADVLFGLLTPNQPQCSQKDGIVWKEKLWLYLKKTANPGPAG